MRNHNNIVPQALQAHVMESLQERMYYIMCQVSTWLHMHQSLETYVKLWWCANEQLEVATAMNNIMFDLGGEFDDDYSQTMFAICHDGANA